MAAETVFSSGYSEVKPSDNLMQIAYTRYDLASATLSICHAVDVTLSTVKVKFCIFALWQPTNTIGCSRCHYTPCNIAVHNSELQLVDNTKTVLPVTLD